MKIYNQNELPIHYAKHTDYEMSLANDNAKLDLALSLLADVLATPELGISEALKYYESFKIKVVDRWTSDWQITREQILDFVNQMRSERKPELYGPARS